MSYILMAEPDPFFIDQATGQKLTPVATLRDPHGGVSQIAVDDNCAVLYNGSYEKDFAAVCHWYPEAIAALFTVFPELLMLPPTEP